MVCKMCQKELNDFEDKLISLANKTGGKLLAEEVFDILDETMNKKC